MRDAVANNTLPTVRHTLELVRNQFEAWRKRRRCRGRISESFWKAAVGLCRMHSIFEVSRAVRINYLDGDLDCGGGGGHSPGIDGLAKVYREVL